MKVLIMTADGFEDSELQIPFDRLQAIDIATDVAAPHKGQIKGKHGHEFMANLALAEVDPFAYDALILPGGNAPAVIEIVKQFFVANKQVAAIRHGPQILASAGVVKGKRVTGYHTIAAELEAAGAKFMDKEVVVDNNLITSRKPSYLPAFIRELISSIQKSTEAGFDGVYRV